MRLASEREKARIKQAKWRQANPEKSYEIHLKRTYGISHVQFSEMFKAQAGKCAACFRKIFKPWERPGRQKKDTACVDHCHVTLKVRGLLCTPCNTSLGVLEDPAKVSMLSAYLSKHAVGVP